MSVPQAPRTILMLYLALVLCLLYLTRTNASPTARSSSHNPFPFDPGFPIQKVVAAALNISTHSWEFGTATEALFELYNPELSVFGSSPFDAAQEISSYSTLPRALSYSAQKIVIGTGPNALSDGDGAELSIRPKTAAFTAASRREASRDSYSIHSGHTPSDRHKYTPVNLQTRGVMNDSNHIWRGLPRVIRLMRTDVPNSPSHHSHSSVNDICVGNVIQTNY
ncbi:hypothetical protein H0H93_008211 [Arthromyces matolae]|nr:hypothetical protein H0H93_008211 [Arthromyces matolae]